MVHNPFASPERGTDSWARRLHHNLSRTTNEFVAASRVALDRGDIQSNRVSNDTRNYLEVEVGNVSLATDLIPESYAAALSHARSLLGEFERKCRFSGRFHVFQSLSCGNPGHPCRTAQESCPVCNS
jgi:hypothetical protein